MVQVLGCFESFSKQRFRSDDSNEQQFTLDIFKLNCLQPWIQNINWHSNHFSLSWNPRTFELADGKEKKLFVDQGMYVKGAKNFITFIQDVVKPNKDPFGLVLFILKEAGSNYLSNVHQLSLICIGLPKV